MPVLNRILLLRCVSSIGQFRIALYSASNHRDCELQPYVLEQIGQLSSQVIVKAYNSLVR